MKALSAFSAPRLLPQPCFVSPFPEVWPPDTELELSHYKAIRDERVFSPSVTWEQEPLGASLIGLATKDWSNPKALVLQKWAEKHRHWWKEWMVRRACYYLMGDHICGMNWEGFVSSVKQLPLFSGDSWDRKGFWMVLFPHLCYHSCISALIQVWAAQSRVNSGGEGREESSMMLWEKAIRLICGETCFAFFLWPLNNTEAYRNCRLVLHHYLKAMYTYRYTVHIFQVQYDPGSISWSERLVKINQINNPQALLLCWKMELSEQTLRGFYNKSQALIAVLLPLMYTGDFHAQDDIEIWQYRKMAFALKYS